MPEVVDTPVLTPYVPSLVVDWLARSPTRTHLRVAGTLAFVDISGFTALTERLARHGHVGAEEMSDALNATFAHLLEVADGYGADLVKWGGDAVLLMFAGPDHAPRACEAAFGMRARLREVGTAARHQIEALMGMRVYLDLHVSVAKDWQRDAKQLKKLGF